MDDPPPPLTRVAPTCSPAPEARLSPGEREVLAALATDKRRREWLLGRAAAKEAVRAAAARAGIDPPPWDAFEVVAGPSGAPRVASPDAWLRALALSLAHGHGQAVALALPAAAGLPGVDLELVRPRPEGTLRFYLTPDEREPLLALPASGAGEEEGPDAAERPPGARDQAAVVLWALKEAAFKALQPPRGLGLLDVRVALLDPPGAPSGRAAVTYAGGLLERAERLGCRRVEAAWTRDGALVLADVLVVGTRTADVL